MSDMGARPLSIGPADSIGTPRSVRGDLVVIANLPKGVECATVHIDVDGKSIGITRQAPYLVNFDTLTLKDGEHVFKAAGKDAEGKELWAATTKVLVHNQGPDAPGAKTRPRPDAPYTATAKPADLVYSSDKYGFTIRFPVGWDVKDETALMKPKAPGGVWLVFGAYPIEKASIVVNIRRRQLEPTTDADIFAKYNNYVTNWERKTILGSPAFVTTTGTSESKRVIHRTIIIKDHNAWMLNCIDTTGGPAETSNDIFRSMVYTLATKTAPSAGPPPDSSSTAPE